MAIVHKSGNIFDTTQPAVAHGVNTQGVMGSGIAREVRRLYPGVYRGYRDFCHGSTFSGGDSLPVYGLSSDSRYSDRWIFNAASQEQPGPSATYEWLRESLDTSLKLARDFGLSGMAVPRIGAGIGGLEWERVLSILEELAVAHADLELEVWTYAP